MYNVGDNVVYPMHGAGVIEAIEERKSSVSARSTTSWLCPSVT